MATADATLVARFGRTERALHWVHAAAFFGMLITGMLLYLPALAGTLGSRPQVKAVHLAVAIAWLAALLLVAILGNRRALRASIRDVDRFDANDRRWLRRAGRGVPQGRFNAGQKLHTHLQSAFAVLWLVSGTLLWLGERNTTFRLSGSIPLHDLTTLAAVVLLAGHLWLALVWPATRPALRGMTLGTVRRDWARQHHATWMAQAAVTPAEAVAPPEAVARRRRPRAGTTVLAVGVCVVGILATTSVVNDARSGTAASPALPRSAAPATPGTASGPALTTADAPGVVLAGRAQELEQAGQVSAAITLYRAALVKLPRRADIRTALAVALAGTGQTAQAATELRRAIRADPSFTDAQLYLGAMLTQTGSVAAGHRELRTYLKRVPGGPGAKFARQLLSRGPSTP